MVYTSKSTEETKRLAEQLAQKIKPGDIIALVGGLGSGKTTFTRYLVDSLGIRERVQSPTFVIARKYSNGLSNIRSINHLDLYRLTTIKEVEEIGLKEYINESGSVTIIEWPEIAEDLLPENTIKLKFEMINENERKIYVENLP